MPVAASRHSLFVAALLVASCDRPAIQSGESLVGAKELPPARVLSREIIQINRGFRGLNSNLLTYELTPDNKLTITLTHNDRDALKKVTDGTESFQLDRAVASQARRDLWRLRPQALRGLAWLAAPADCPAPPNDTLPEASVAFIAEGPKPGVEDDQIGVTDIPAAFACKTKQGIQARQIIEKVLQSFPTSKIVSEFEKRQPKVVLPAL